MCFEIFLQNVLQNIPSKCASKYSWKILTKVFLKNLLQNIREKFGPKYSWKEASKYSWKICFKIFVKNLFQNIPEKCASKYSWKIWTKIQHVLQSSAQFADLLQWKATATETWKLATEMFLNIVHWNVPQHCSLKCSILWNPKHCSLKCATMLATKRYRNIATCNVRQHWQLKCATTLVTEMYRNIGNWNMPQQCAMMTEMCHN